MEPAEQDNVVELDSGPPRYVEYRNYKITVTDNFRFVISGEGWPENKGPLTSNQDYIGCSSLIEAKKQIDEFLETKAKVDKASAKLAIPCVNQDGKRVVVKGFHMNTGAALTLSDGEQGGDLYPAEEWVEKLLLERKALFERGQEIGHSLRKLRVSGKVTYGKTRLGEYDRLLEKFVQQLTDAAEAAKTMEQPKP